MTPEQVQTILHDFANRARLLRRYDDGSEAWRFDVDGRSYDLHYHADDPKRAAREFTTLQAMQTLGIPATRVVANLKGFRIDNRKGDATILVHDHETVPLLDLLLRGTGLPARLSPAAQPSPSRETGGSAGGRADRQECLSYEARTALTASLIALLESLHRERLVPRPLTLDAFALRGADGVVIVRDGAMRFDGVVTVDRLGELDAATRAITTSSERLRVWRHFADDPPPRRRDAAIGRRGRRLARSATAGEDGAFGTLFHERGGDERWVGRYLRHATLALPWSAASRATFDRDDWLAAMPEILAGDAWQTMKHDAAASVRAGAIDVGGTRLDVVVKRPTFKPGVRGFFNQFRRARVRRTWSKTWRMLGLGFRCEVPLLVMERRVGGRVCDQLLVVERVPGPTFAQIELNAMTPPARGRLLYAAGRVLREIERHGFTHRDAKHTNWIAWTDPADGVVKPALIDLDGVRFQRWRGAGLARLTRAMRTRADVTDADVVTIERGFHGRDFVVRASSP